MVNLISKLTIKIKWWRDLWSIDYPEVFQGGDQDQGSSEVLAFCRALKWSWDNIGLLVENDWPWRDIWIVFKFNWNGKILNWNWILAIELICVLEIISKSDLNARSIWRLSTIVRNWLADYWFLYHENLHWETTQVCPKLMGLDFSIIGHSPPSSPTSNLKRVSQMEREQFMSNSINQIDKWRSWIMMKQQDKHETWYQT